MILGIDLGTTNSLAAAMVDGQPQLIRNALGELLTPSVVGIDDDGKLLVGRAAKEFQVLHPERCASLFKRHMGAEWKATLAGRAFRPEELSACVLSSLKADAERHLGQSVDRAVISVPAYFDEFRRRATMRAGELAGFRVERIINEPTAAAIAYGLHDIGEDKTVLVYDLGGGTFDVSIVEIFEGVVEVRASSGECFLGGEDFSRLMAVRVLQSQGMNFEHVELSAPALISRLIQQCERAKCALSSQDTAVVAVPTKNGEITELSPRVTVTRDEFNVWTAALLAQTELPLRRSLADSQKKRDEIHEIVLVGGATRMPAVVDRVANWFGKPPHSRLDPDHVVALGAAIQAGLVARDAGLGDLVVTDVAPFTLGIEICKDIGVETKGGYFLPIIHRNTTIPVSRVKRVVTINANQNAIDVRVFQGDARKVDDNLLLGNLSVQGIPRGPAGQEVDVRFTYDTNGVLEVEATIVATGRRAAAVITKHAVGLTPRDIEEALARMASLKVSAKEDQENSYLLKRAERLYRELPAEHRRILEGIIDAFESALEMGGIAEIAVQREMLAELLDHLDNGMFPNSGESDVV